MMGFPVNGQAVIQTKRLINTQSCLRGCLLGAVRQHRSRNDMLLRQYWLWITENRSSAQNWSTAPKQTKQRRIYIARYLGASVGDVGNYNK